DIYCTATKIRARSGPHSEAANQAIWRPQLTRTAMLKGKTALVTGSTSGIGLATARSLAQAGCNIMLNGFGEAAAIEKERAGLEQEFGVKALYSTADMSKPAEIAGMIQTTEKNFGAIDVLVNNAGIQHVANIE